MMPNWLIAASLVEKMGVNGSGRFITLLASMRMVSCLDSETKVKPEGIACIVDVGHPDMGRLADSKNMRGIAAAEAAADL